MKKVIAALIALVCCHGVYAQDEKEDAIYLNASKTVYIGSSTLAAGWNFGLNTPDGIDKTNCHSNFLSWDVLDFNFQSANKRHTFTAGFGMAWNRYASDNLAFIKKNGMINPGTMEHSDYSRYLTYGLNIPLTYTFEASNGLFVSAGPVVNFNLYSSMYYEFNNEQPNNLSSATVKSVYHNPVTVDLRLMFGYKHIGLMFKYSPMNVIEKNKGPEFQSFGVGLVLR